MQFSRSEGETYESGLDSYDEIGVGEDGTAHRGVLTCAGTSGWDSIGSRSTHCSRTRSLSSRAYQYQIKGRRRVLTSTSVLGRGHSGGTYRRICQSEDEESETTDIRTKVCCLLNCERIYLQW